MALPACEYTDGITQGCKPDQSGIRYFYLTNFENVASYTVVSGKITAITMTSSSPALHFWKFDLQSPTQGGKSTITSPLKAPNGPAVYTHTAILNFNGLEAAKNLVVEMTAKARTVAVAVMRSGKAFYLGAVNGLDLTDGAWEGGVKGEDFSGYTVTLMGEEAKFPYEFDTALLVAPKFP